MMPGRAAAALPARLARTRLRACRCFMTSSFTPPDGLGDGDGTSGAHPPVIAGDDSTDGHPECRENRRDGDPFPKEGTEPFYVAGGRLSVFDAPGRGAARFVMSSSRPWNLARSYTNASRVVIITSLSPANS